jgi:uncharacterized membrane protein YfcA
VNRSRLFAFLSGGAVAFLGGLVGLGGAEFRLPILVGFFGFSTLIAVIINKVISLAVVVFAIVFRSSVIGFDELLPYLGVIVNILIGSIAGAYLGANYALKIEQKILNRIILTILVVSALSMLFGHSHLHTSKPLFENTLFLYFSGILAGFFIGIIAAVLGVAGGEFIIPTLILLYGCEPKIAGSLSLCISLPTMLTAFMRYSKSEQFKEVVRQKEFVVLMIAGSFLGAALGAAALSFVNSEFVSVLLGAILLISAFKVFRTKK